MNSRRKVFTLEKVKLSSMGPDTIVYIPRALIKHKVLDPEKIYNVHFEELPDKDQTK